MSGHPGIAFSPSIDLYPFESKWFESSVGPIHYVDEGAGRPILFSHGNPTWSFLYRDVIADLRGRHRCIAADLPGFGLSARPDGYGYTPAEHATVLGELVDGLGLDDLIVMGQDWGGPVVLRMAADRADHITGVVLGNTWFWPESGFMFRFGGRFLGTSFLSDRVVRPSSTIGGLIWSTTAGPLSDEVKRHYEGVQPEGASAGVREFPRQLVHANPWLAELEKDVRAALGAKQALIVWGMKDMAFKPKPFLTRVRDAFEDHVVVELADAKHYIQEDAPDAIVAAILDRFGDRSADEPSSQLADA